LAEIIRKYVFSLLPLLARPAASIETPHNVGGELMVATVKDPWGNLIGIIYNLDFQVK
jgi:lactoylglutathione lyase